MVDYDGADGSGSGDGKLVKKLSKSRRIVKESKSFKGLKNLQKPLGWKNIYRGIDPLSKNSNF